MKKPLAGIINISIKINVNNMLPLAENVNAQFAMRYEDLSDVDRALVGKIAIGWEITDGILFRASAKSWKLSPDGQINHAFFI